MNMLICALMICGAVLSHASESDDWNYDREDAELGPDSGWTSIGYCGGLSQSPIDVVPNADQEYDQWVASGYFNTDPSGPVPTEMTNNGHTVQINVRPGEEEVYLITGAGLPAKYQAVQAHLHWGSTGETGSEHTWNGRQFPAEFHVVHLDLANNGGDPYAALEQPQGVAVLGFFIEEGEHNSAWDPFFEGIPYVQYKDQSYEFEAPFALGSLFPTTLSKFARYNGSLTTPGCLETVLWTVFEETIKMSADQLAQLRTHSSISEEKEVEEGPQPLVDNWRPVQPLNGRTVYRGNIAEGPSMLSGESCGVEPGTERCDQIDVDPRFICQCNAYCTQNGDCCSDYRDICQVRVCSYVHTYKNKSRKQRQ